MLAFFKNSDFSSCFFQEKNRTVSDFESNQVSDGQQVDRVKECSLCLLRLFFILEDFKDAVRMGDGDRLAALRKVLLKHFKSDAGYNCYCTQLNNTHQHYKEQAHQTR